MAKKIMRQKKVLLVSLLILILVGTCFLIFKPDLKEFVLPIVPGLSTKGFVKVEVQIEQGEEGGLISLVGNCYALTATADSTQIESIQNALAKKIVSRPNTHDLMAGVFSNLGIEVLMVKVVELRGNFYIGQLIIKQGDVILNLDCRPSDGIALALRLNAPIYVNETLLEKNGEKVC